MIKKTGIILLSVNLLVSKPAPENNTSREGVSFAKVAKWCGVGAGAAAVTAGAVVYAPIVMPAIITGAKVATGAAVAAAKLAGIKAAAAPITVKINAAIIAGKAGRKFVYVNQDEKLQAALQNESCECFKTRLDFQTCLNKHSTNKDANSLEIPSACQETGMLLSLLEQEKLSQHKNDLVY